MATVKALASGFTYQPIDHLATAAPIEEALARLLAVHHGAGPQEIPKVRDAEALLGGAPKPTVTVSEAFQIYVGEIAYNAQLYKSPNQQAAWEKTKRTSIQYFIFTGPLLWGFQSSGTDKLAFKNLLRQPEWAVASHFKAMQAGETFRFTGQLSLLTSRRYPSDANRGAAPASPAGRGFLPHRSRSMAE